MDIDRSALRKIEKRLELINYLANAASDYLKLWHDVAPVWQRYCEGKIVLHVHVVGVGSENAVRNRFCIRCWPKFRNLMELFVENDQAPVFVEVGEVAEKCNPAPSLVRLMPLEECEMFFPKPFEQQTAPIFEEIWRVFNRELDSIGNFARTLLDHDASDIIERASQAVRKLPDYNSDPGDREIVRMFADDHIRVTIVGDGILVNMRNVALQPRQVFVAPLYQSLDSSSLFNTRISPIMAQKEKEEPTQKTAKDYEIPIPKRGDFLRNLKKAAKPSGPRRPNK